MARSTSSTSAAGGAGGLDQHVAQLHAGHLDGVLQRQEQPGLGPLPRRERRVRSTPSSGHAAAEHLVAGPAGDHVGQRRLARAVRAHHDVHLAGADGEVDAPQDLLPGDRHPQVAHLEHGHQPSTTAPSHARDVDHHVAAVHRDRVDRRRARPPAGTCGSPVRSENVEPCFQHSISQSLSEHLALRQRHVGVAAGVVRARDQSSSMRTTAIRLPVDRRRAGPRRSAARRAPITRCLMPPSPRRRSHRGVRSPSLAATRAPQRRRQRRHRQPGDDLVEEAAQDQPLGHRRAARRGSRGRSAGRRRWGRRSRRGSSARRCSRSRGRAPTRPRPARTA